MKSIKIILIGILGLVLSHVTQAQTITKTASKSSVYIGETFTYTIALENITDFSRLDKVIDLFGEEVDVLNVTQSNSMQLLSNWGFCSSITDTRTTLASGETRLELSFNSCTGSTSMFNRIYIKVEVRLNDKACDDNTISNVAELHLSNPTQVITSDPSIVNVNLSNPLVLQKSFFKYDLNPLPPPFAVLYYDVRLTSESGNFYNIDPSSQSFIDEFQIPDCYDNITQNDIEVVYIPDESNRNNEITIPQSKNISGNILEIKWSIPNYIDYEKESSLLFAVKINVTECNCKIEETFNLLNDVEFNFKNICGDKLAMKDGHDIIDATCNLEQSMPSDCELSFEKSFQLKDNDLGLTMKGCEGTYIIDIVNCSTNLKYSEITVSDLVPQELDINIINTNGWGLTRTGRQLVVTGGGLNPGDRHRIEIEFKVRTNLPDHLIENCADINIKANNIFTGAPKTIQKRSCTRFKTVPNEVTVATIKKICSKGGQKCGTLSSSGYLPGDKVEYELFFYNYGNADVRNVVVEDVLPDYLTVNPSGIEVYKISSGNPIHKAECQTSGFGSSYRDYRNITNSVNVNYPTPANSNRLRIRMGRNIMDAFTCKGVTFYKVKINGVINQNVQSGTYSNQFTVKYKDTSIPAQRIAISDKVNYTVNLDNLILGWKRVEGSPKVDCKNNTTTVKYSIAVANMGNMAVNVDIEDSINISSGLVNIANGPHNFEACVMTSASITLCTPSAINPTSYFNSYTPNPDGFSIRRQPIQPCSMLYFTYEVTYDTDLLSGNETAEICNEIDVWAYTGRRRITPIMYKKNPEEYKNNIIVSLNPGLNDTYMKAKSTEEKLRITQIMKAYKANPKLLSSPNSLAFIDTNVLSDLSNSSFNPFTGVFFGTATWGKGGCIEVEDCLPKDQGCFNSKNSNPFNFELTNINTTTGEVSTTLSNLPPNITKIEYTLSDVEFSEFCNETTIYIGPYPWVISCRQCDGDVTGNFRPVNTNPIGSGPDRLVFDPYPFGNYSTFNGTYKEWNIVDYIGGSISLPVINKNFILPNISNCSGNYAYSITALVYFEDCDICYVSAAIDFRTYYDWKWSINQLGHQVDPNISVIPK